MKADYFNKMSASQKATWIVDGTLRFVDHDRIHSTQYKEGRTALWRSSGGRHHIIDLKERVTKRAGAPYGEPGRESTFLKAPAFCQFVVGHPVESASCPRRSAHRRQPAHLDGGRWAQTAHFGLCWYSIHKGIKDGTLSVYLDEAAGYDAIDAAVEAENCGYHLVKVSGGVDLPPSDRLCTDHILDRWDLYRVEDVSDGGPPHYTDLKVWTANSFNTDPAWDGEGYKG